ncbi:hypothetical protein [Pseudomonas savastanoi]|uniref:hypothetical protein n=1 Tax=Pseudomonas savastanoi TaxID=29438 RepID=UPI000E327363|nr:hypothetical protein [Pseudomonas savastanoi]
MASTQPFEAFKDEAPAFQFMLKSPWHAVVLGRIAAAMEKYKQALDAAKNDGDAAMQKEIEVTTRFLKYEASDRVNIKFEYLVVESFERLRGESAVDGLLDYQRTFIKAQQIVEWAAVPYSQPLEQEFALAGLLQATSWGIESGRANISQQTRLRSARHHLFELTRQMNRAYSQGERQQGWRLRQRCHDARKLIGPLATMECKSKALTSIRALHGEAESERVLRWVKAHTRLPEYEAMRNSIQAYRCEPGSISQGRPGLTAKAG